MSGIEDETERDRRQSMRRGVELDADVTDSAGLFYAAKVADISEEGCMIRTLSGQNLVRDRLHSIKITGLEALTGYVTWSGDGKAGLVFSASSNPATVESLVMKSHYARISRQAAHDERAADNLRPLPPFPFDD